HEDLLGADLELSIVIAHVRIRHLRHHPVVTVELVMAERYGARFRSGIALGEVLGDRAAPDDFVATGRQERAVVGVEAADRLIISARKSIRPSGVFGLDGRFGRTLRTAGGGRRRECEKGDAGCKSSGTKTDLLHRVIPERA